MYVPFYLLPAHFLVHNMLFLVTACAKPHHGNLVDTFRILFQGFFIERFPLEIKLFL